jgi:hypothetical protein
MKASHFIDIQNVSANVMNQATTANRRNFQKNLACYDLVFKGNEAISISRNEVFQAFDRNAKEGIASAFVWGFPKGGRGNMKSILSENIDELAAMISEISARSLEKVDYLALNKFRGLKYATITKFLYFSKIKIGHAPCLIFDRMVKSFIVDNKPIEYSKIVPTLERKTDKLDYETYSEYVQKTFEISTNLGFSDPASIEMYFFKYSPSRKRTADYTE